MKGRRPDAGMDVTPNRLADSIFLPPLPRRFRYLGTSLRPRNAPWGEEFEETYDQYDSQDRRPDAGMDVTPNRLADSIFLPPLPRRFRYLGTSLRPRNAPWGEEFEETYDQYDSQQPRVTSY